MSNQARMQCLIKDARSALIIVFAPCFLTLGYRFKTDALNPEQSWRAGVRQHLTCNQRSGAFGSR